MGVERNFAACCLIIFCAYAVLYGVVELTLRGAPVLPSASGFSSLPQQFALQALANLREQQASALAYFDVFWVLALVIAALAFVVLLMKRSFAEKGARIGSE